jgi:hypothetical protein
VALRKRFQSGPPASRVKKGNNMMKIKLTILAILASMYGIALSENGVVQTISWVLFLGLFMALFAQMEKRYGI